MRSSRGIAVAWTTKHTTKMSNGQTKTKQNTTDLATELIHSIVVVVVSDVVIA